MYSTIFFDLDGTLTDSGEGIINSVVYALECFGFPIPENETLRKFIGPPLADSLTQNCGMTYEQAEVATVRFREYFSAKGWKENRVYDGIESMLIRLRAAGKRLFVATSKPEEFAVRILDEFGLSKYFDHICGAPMHAPAGYGKADVIRKAILLSGARKTDILMVGDRYHDIQGAHTMGLDAVGVLYGYGDRAEHELYGADYILEDVRQLEMLLLRGDMRCEGDTYGSI